MIDQISALGALAGPRLVLAASSLGQTPISACDNRYKSIPLFGSWSPVTTGKSFSC